MIDPTSAISSPPGPPGADPMDPASSPASPPTIGSSRLTGPLVGVDTETWTPADADEATAAIAAVADYCRDYCPARLACVEERCRLYRLEQRAADALGLQSNPATEAVGVLGQSITAL